MKREMNEKYEKKFNGHTYYLVKTPLITDRAIAEKIAEDQRWDYRGSIFGSARIITEQQNNQEYFLVYRYLDTSKLLAAYYDIGN